MERFKLLIVEDNQSARNHLSKVIAKEGFKVIAASNGVEGLKIFKKEKPQIVITDIKMPQLNGLDLVKKIKNINADTQIILITAYGEIESAILALKEGVLDYIKKPIDLDILSIALGRAVEKITESKTAITYPTLLLAEDNELTRKHLSKVLKQEGWKILTAVNGEDAINKFNTSKVDIVLLDIKMPKKDGLTCLSEMRKINNDFEAVILSGYGEESDAIEAMRNGAINFLKKPIDINQLIIVVEKAIEKLTIHRSLKYRNRELELTKELIAKITYKKEFVVDINEEIQQPIISFARDLLNGLPLCLGIVDRNLKFKFINNHWHSKINSVKVDSDLIKRMKGAGFKNITKKYFVQKIESFYKSSKKKIETIISDDQSFLFMTPVIVVNNNEKEKVVLIIIQGKSCSR